jgi:hypothetical protein
MFDHLTLDQPIGGSNPPSPADPKEILAFTSAVPALRHLTTTQKMAAISKPFAFVQTATSETDLTIKPIDGTRHTALLAPNGSS